MKSLVFLDVETTGLKAAIDRIIEIYMLKVDANGDVEDYHTLINPQRSLPAIITEITGLTDIDLVDAPIEADVAVPLREFIGNGELVAHNLSFDKRFIVELFTRNKCQPILSGGIDTLAISRRLFPKLCIYPQGEGSHKLKNLMYHFQLEKDFANSHRAEDDVMLLVQVYRNLQRYALGQGLTYPEAMVNGCPTCGQAMRLVIQGSRRKLVCFKGDKCSQQIVI